MVTRLDSPSSSGMSVTALGIWKVNGVVFGGVIWDGVVGWGGGIRKGDGRESGFMLSGTMRAEVRFETGRSDGLGIIV